MQHKLKIQSVRYLATYCVLVCCIQASQGARKARMHDRLGVYHSGVSNKSSAAKHVCCCKKTLCSDNSVGKDKNKAVNHDPREPDVKHIESEKKSGKIKPRCCKRRLKSCSRMGGYMFRRVDAWCEPQDHPEYKDGLHKAIAKAKETGATRVIRQTKVLVEQSVKFDGRRRMHAKQPVEWPRLSMMLSTVRMGLLNLDIALQQGDVGSSNPGALLHHCNAHRPDATMRTLTLSEVKVDDTIIQDELEFVDFRGCFASPSKDFQEMNITSVSELGNYLESTSVWQNTVGQSGSAVFIFGKYVLKQVKAEEMETFSRITHRGAAHWGLGKDIETCGENSLLTPFFFAMRSPHDAHWWILMEKIGLHDRDEEFWYDIKGPMWSGAKDGKSYVDATIGGGNIARHKDMFFYNHVKSDRAGLQLRECDCRRLSELVRSDVQLLRHAGITDYSFFIKLYMNTDSTRYDNESTCDPNYLPTGPKRRSECFRQYPVILETPKYTLAIGIVDFGERGWKSLPMSTMTEPSLYAQSFQQSLPVYFRCPHKDQALMRQKYQQEFQDVSPKDTKVICDCPVLIKEGGSANDENSVFVRATSPDASFKCSDLTDKKEVQPQCFNSDGQYIGTPHKFLNAADANEKDSHILCFANDALDSKEFRGAKFRVSFSRTWGTHSKDMWFGPAYWQIGNYAKGKTCKSRGIPDERKVEREKMLQQRMASLAAGAHDDRHVLKRSGLLKQTHTLVVWQPKDFNLTVYQSSMKPRMVLEYSRRSSTDESNRRENVFDVCNEILNVGLVTTTIFKIRLNNAASGYDEYTFKGDDAADWVQEILSAQASCEHPCFGTVQQRKSLSYCAEAASTLNEDLEDEDISERDDMESKEEDDSDIEVRRKIRRIQSYGSSS